MTWRLCAVAKFLRFGLTLGRFGARNEPLFLKDLEERL
jgi:hypothetical protein